VGQIANLRAGWLPALGRVGNPPQDSIPGPVVFAGRWKRGETDSVGQFCIPAVGGELYMGRQHSESLHELSGAEGGITELKARPLEFTGGVKAVESAPVQHSAVFECTVDEFGIVHTDLNPDELLALDRRHVLPFKIYEFTGTLAGPLESYVHTAQD
jgi:hypothetical protein